MIGTAPQGLLCKRIEDKRMIVSLGKDLEANICVYSFEYERLKLDRK